MAAGENRRGPRRQADSNRPRRAWERRNRRRRRKFGTIQDALSMREHSHRGARRLYQRGAVVAHARTGMAAGIFALELAIDELARKLRMDRLEFRRRNNETRYAQFNMIWAPARSNGMKKAARRSPKVQSNAESASPRLGGMGLGGRVHRRRRSHFATATSRYAPARRISARAHARSSRWLRRRSLGFPSASAEIGDTRYPFSVPAAPAGAIKHAGDPSGGSASEGKIVSHCGAYTGCGDR